MIVTCAQNGNYAVRCNLPECPPGGNCHVFGMGIRPIGFAGTHTSVHEMGIMWFIGT
jgi:hypothetical protein